MPVIWITESPELTCPQSLCLENMASGLLPSEVVGMATGIGNQCPEPVRLSGRPREKVPYPGGHLEEIVQGTF